LSRWVVHFVEIDKCVEDFEYSVSGLDVFPVIIVQDGEGPESGKVLGAILLSPHQAAKLHLIENPSIPNEDCQRLPRTGLT
jgi:hypothetical protein